MCSAIARRGSIIVDPAAVFAMASRVKSRLPGHPLLSTEDGTIFAAIAPNDIARNTIIDAVNHLVQKYMEATADFLTRPSYDWVQSHSLIFAQVLQEEYMSSVATVPVNLELPADSQDGFENVEFNCFSMHAARRVTGHSNLGDEVQLLAAIQYLPQLDGFLDRSSIAGEGAKRNKTIYIIGNHFYSPRYSDRPEDFWPPPPNVHLLPISMYFRCK